jgi:radical SAM-linked protein
VNLSRFQRPSRYIDSEINVLKKEAPLRVALAFPDIYDVGMSHLGLRILYDIVNSIPYASAERVFHPWLDLEQEIKACGKTITSLESRRPLGEFDVVGFSLQYELSYTSVLNMLRLGGIPLRAAERESSRKGPLIIAGGPCTVNPMPMSPFVDAFLVGDGEEAIKEILDVVYRAKSEGGERKSILKALATIEGVFVPGVSPGAKRRIVKSLDDAPYPISPIVPFTEIVHDRINIEVSRGCSMGCRFCQAGVIYRPMRERSPEKVLEIASKSLKATGYEEIAFTSLSAGDYSCLLPLIKSFNRKFAESRIGISLPSLRVKAVDKEILKEIRSVRKTGFTIAPEAATERLRAAINKDFKEEDFHKAVQSLFKEGWQNLKLYFMIGLPGERDEDIEAIPQMVKKTLKVAKSHSSRYINITVAVSPFVPKSHTPFQWCGQADMDYMKEKRDYLRQNLKRINIRGHDERMSLLEAAFARGDERLADLLEAALAEGSRLDGWTEAFDYAIWLRAMEKTGVKVEEYAKRQYSPGDRLPWDVIDIGVDKKYLENEYARSLENKVTEECRAVCSECGLECEDGGKPENMALNTVRLLKIQETPARNPIRVRAEFSKTGLMRHLSHRELMTHVTRALRRAGVQLEYTQGFHPNPKVAFGPPLGVGVAGLREYFDIGMYPTIALSALMDRINSSLSPGVKVNEMAAIGLKDPSLQGFVSRYIYEIITTDHGDFREFMSSSEVLVQRDKGPVDARQMVVEGVVLGPDRVSLTLSDLENVKVRLDEIMEAVFKKRAWELDITRIQICGFQKGQWIPPLEVKSKWQVAS